MRQFKIAILLITGCIIFSACPNFDGVIHNITFINNAEKKVSIQEYFLTANFTSEDTLFQCRKPAVGVPSGTLSYIPAGRHSDWVKMMMVTSFLQLLVLDGETYSEYISPPNCDTIRKYVPILHRYQLSLEDLQRMNWTVVYPPEE